MSSSVSFITIDPLFEVQEGKIDEFIATFQPFASNIVSEEPKNLSYDFTVCGNMVHCREFYADAEGVLAHIARVNAALAQAATISTLVKISLHGPATELDKLKEPLKDFPLPISYFVLYEGCGSSFVARK